MTKVVSNNPEFRILREREYYILQKRGWFFWRTFTLYGKFGGIGAERLFGTTQECEEQARQWKTEQKENKVVKYFDI